MTTTGIVAGCGPGQDLKAVPFADLRRPWDFLVSVFASLIFHMKSLNGLGI